MNRLAIRNLFRHRARSTIALFAIAFSMITIQLATGFAERVFDDLRIATIETGVGHLQVTRKGFATRGVADPFAFLLPAGSPELAAFRSMPHVVSVGERLEFNGLLSHDEGTLSFAGLGVEPQAEKAVSKNLSFLAGSDLEDGRDDQVIVGEGLASNMHLKVGDRVVLLVTTSSGSTNAFEGTVHGIFSTQVRAFDEFALRVTLGTARRLLRVGGSHRWVALLDDGGRVPDVTRQLEVSLDPRRFEITPWLQLADAYRKTVTFMSGQLGVLRMLIVVIALLGISNMLIMNVLERTGEIGTLMAMGARRTRVVGLFLLESLYLGIVGSIIGVVLSLVFARIITTIGIPMPPPPGRSAAYLGGILVTPGNLLVGTALAMITTVAAAVYPAVKAARLHVVDALRHNR